VTIDVFEVGSRWRHKRQREIFVFIKNRSQVDGRYVFKLGDIPTSGMRLDPGREFSATCATGWTAEELIREFEPLLSDYRPSALDRVLGGGAVIDDDD
jgi:hypothetical protein